MARQIFEETRIGNLTLANRLVRSATWDGLADPEGGVTARMLELYRELAAGGVGLIVSGYAFVRPDGRQWATQLGAHRDALIPELAELAATVHRAGGTLVGQIVHCGGQAYRKACGGQPVAPSGVDSPGYTETPRELTTAEVEEIVAAFGAAAGRLQRAGFDGVQLHGAHGYLMASFLSPARNRRLDRFGGDVENRARFALECYRAVRDAVGDDFPVLIKLNAHDFLEGSTTEEDARYLAAALAEAGIDAIEVSGGTGGSGELGAARTGIDGPADEAYFLPQIRVIRAAARGVPLILVGGVRSLERMEEILKDGDADYFALCRPLIREPDLPRRWRDGDRRRADCISCRGCFKPTMKGSGVKCVRLRDAAR